MEHAAGCDACAHLNRALKAEAQLNCGGICGVCLACVKAQRDLRNDQLAASIATLAAERATVSRLEGELAEAKQEASNVTAELNAMNFNHSVEFDRARKAERDLATERAAREKAEGARTSLLADLRRSRLNAVDRSLHAVGCTVQWGAMGGAGPWFATTPCSCGFNDDCLAAAERVDAALKDAPFPVAPASSRATEAVLLAALKEVLPLAQRSYPCPDGECLDVPNGRDCELDLGGCIRVRRARSAIASASPEAAKLLDELEALRELERASIENHGEPRDKFASDCGVCRALAAVARARGGK
jgi:hypothetical protein